MSVEDNLWEIHKEAGESPVMDSREYEAKATRKELEALRKEVRALKEHVECLARDQKTTEECLYQLSFPDKLK